MILTTFPSLEKLGVNLEIAFYADDSEIMRLLHAFALAGVQVVLGEVVLVQLPPGARKHDARLRELELQLRATKAVPTSPPRTRKTKDVAFRRGHRVPAIFALCAPPAVQEGVSAAMWESVWAAKD